MKYLILFISLIFSLGLNAQNKIEGIVLNQETKEVIPFVNISMIGIDRGTSSLENGRFSLEMDSSECELIFSSVGYENKIINCTEVDTVYLVPQNIILNEFVIQEQKKNKFLSIGQFKKEDTSNGFSTRKAPWVVARFFSYKGEYEKTPFLNEIKICTDSDLKKAEMGIRIYEKGKNGMPGELLHDQAISITVKKNKRITTLDISDLRILIPKNGVFIALEWIFQEKNYHRYKVFSPTENKSKKVTGVEPLVKALLQDEKGEGFMFKAGKWRTHKKVDLSKSQFRNTKGDNKYWTPAIELKLSN